MPVEIRELIIKATTTVQNGQNQPISDAQQTSYEQEAIIEECVQRVLKILERHKER